jgi:uncharacterized membrane protein
VEGFWFVPGAVALGGVALAAAMLALDHALGGPEGTAFAFGGDAQAARQILATIAGSLITVAGLAFSITIVVLTLVSNQFTPRVVSGFLGDRVNQVVAGAFVGIFAYCLIVLRAVRSETVGGPFVPSISVSVSIGLALLALALLLVFIHHVGQSIEASNIAMRISRSTLAAIDDLYPEPAGREVDSGRPADVGAWRREGRPAVVRSVRHGYVQTIELEELAEALGRPRVHVVVRPGDFVDERAVLVEAWPGEELDEDTERSACRCVVVGGERDLAQDAGFGLWQLADIAAKALSPGVNDPTTAVTALEHLGAVLVRLAGRSLPSGARRVGGTEVVAEVDDFADLVEGPFAEVARSLGGNARVAANALGALGAAGAAACAAGAETRLGPLRRAARAVVEATKDRTVNAYDRSVLEAAAADAAEVLGPLT